MGLSISGVSGYDTLFPIYNANPVSPVRPAVQILRGSEGLEGTYGSGKNKPIGTEECQTCKQRKYVDGSNENDVSFKTPGHIDPQVSGATVMAHERQHVANAVAEGNEPGKQLLSSTVSLKTSVCPECGRVYVAGGVTQTTMKTTQENPYVQLQRNLNRHMSAGLNFDMNC